MNKSDTRIIFFGTSTFALPSLNALLSSGYNVVSTVTNPDEPSGRKRILTAPPVKILSLKYKIPVYQPVDLANEIQEISEADLFIIVAFGTIIPQILINKPRLGTINIHPSFLPRWRGPSPIQSVILNDDIETGVTLIKIDELMDHGPIIAQKKFSLAEKKWTSPELHHALADMGAEMLIGILPEWIAGTIVAIPQDDNKATYCKLIKKNNGRILWSRSAAEIERMIRAYTPWPSAWTLWPGRDAICRIRIDEADILDEESPVGSPGYIWQTPMHPLLVKTALNTLVVRKITIEGKTTLDAKVFLRGNPQLLGATFI